MKIAHISDVHIRLKERHKEYEEVFNRLYDKLKEQKPDRILLSGDVVHSKITLSPELVSLMKDFFMSLQEIAPVDMIVGNHDMNLSNKDRMDALTPVVDMVKDHGYGLTYILATGLYEVAEGFVYGVYSLMDGEDIQLRKKDKEDGKTYIAIYHGPVAGCKFDNDYMFSDATTPITTFNNFDFVLLGDMHKRQFLNNEQTISYPGSLIQQTHGEDLKKGFMMWNIKNSDIFTSEFIHIPNDYAFATIYAEDGILPDLDLPPKTRIRVIWPMKAKDISRAETTRLSSLIRSKYNPLSLQLSFKPIEEIDFGEIEVDEFTTLADPDVQADLLKQWFMNLDEDVNIDALMVIDKKVTDTVSSNELEDFRNSKWVLKKITMENFMSYADEVTIDFDKMKGVIGLFGDNAVGKSVIIDAMLYALFNKTTREVKNADLVNTNVDSDVCRVKLRLEIRDIEYEIDRWTTRQYQKRSGEFINARTDVTFKRRYNKDCEWENLTDTQRSETEKIIRNAIGKYDDFMITTLSTQGGITEFMKLKRSPRADAMLRFLGLEIFNKKYDYAKEVFRKIKTERKGYDEDSELEMLDTKKKLRTRLKREHTTLTKKLDASDSELTKIRNDISDHATAINQTITIDKDVGTLIREYDSLGVLLEHNENDKLALEKKVKTLVDKMDDLENKYIFDDGKMFKLTGLRDQGNAAKKEIGEHNIEIDANKKVLKVYKADLKKGNKCPVSDDDRHTSCVYLSGHIAKKKECMDIINAVNDSQGKIDELEGYLQTIEYAYNTLDEQETIRGYVERAVIKLSGYNKDLLAIQNSIEVKQVSLSLIKSQLKLAKRNADTIQKNRDHKHAIEDLNVSLEDETKRRGEINGECNERSVKIILIEEEISDIEEILEKILETEGQHRLFNTYCTAMHRNGLPVDILRKYIPKINSELNRILTGVVDFSVDLKIDEGETEIDVVMCYDGDENGTRPAQMASGMEKLLINMAIRYSLISVSNLNTPSSWILDEGFGTLDPENIAAMSLFFDNVKGTFNNIIIITHIEILKDTADYVLNIEKIDGNSKIYTSSTK